MTRTRRRLAGGGCRSFDYVMVMLWFFLSALLLILHHPVSANIWRIFQPKQGKPVPPSNNGAASSSISSSTRGGNTTSSASGEVSDAAAAGDENDPMDSLETSWNWSKQGKIAGFDVEGGVDFVADGDKVPYSLWGRARRKISRIGTVTADIDAEGSDLTDINVDVNADTGTTRLRIEGNANVVDGTVHVSKVRLCQDVDIPGQGIISLIPTYDVNTKKADMQVAFRKDGTIVRLGRGMNEQSVTFTHFIDDTSAITPTISMDGDLELEYRKQLDAAEYGIGGSITASFRPRNCVNIKYQNGPWIANAKAPIQGYYKLTDGIKFSLKKALP